ncbi:MAG TPA: VTT domain-containing protein [Blastocatellia bacterium]|nr:VTT domain-containing protein [Blastocatellia bacterium]
MRLALRRLRASRTPRPSLVLGAAVAVAGLSFAFHTLAADARGLAASAGAKLPLDIGASDMPLPALLLAGTIAASTLISEDLTCIAAGLLIAQGQIGFGLGAFSCFLGIFIGDILLFLTGRYLGRPALSRAPLKWFVRMEDVNRSSDWFSQRGAVVIFASRFVPGARLPAYFAAGLLNTSLWRFSVYFLIAAAVWTPLVVGLALLLGGEVIESALFARQALFIKVGVAVALSLAIARFAVRLSSYRGRRLLVSSWRRATRWEFWPLWVFYVPVVCYVALLALKHRSLTLFTASNPAMPAGGFVGESKIDILRGLEPSGNFIAKSELIESALTHGARVEKAESFIARNGLGLPIVLKPNEGQRGSGVSIIRTSAGMREYLANMQVDTIVQEYVAGVEFGVFYIRRPGDPSGQIFSITEKRMPAVVGDGISTLEKLILEDNRAVCMARLLLKQHKPRASQVPARGERMQLVELGTHSRGAVFLDGSWTKTPELHAKIDEISQGFIGFYFGRFDIRTPAVDEFKAGQNFKIIELNGVTSEATHIYDPKNNLLDAYRVLFAQWKLAFEIGALNRDRGFRPSSAKEVFAMLSEYRQRARLHLS